MLVVTPVMLAVVTRINVAEGQEVAKGDLLVVLESMKMENYVYAPATPRCFNAATRRARSSLMRADIILPSIFVAIRAFPSYR